MNLGASMSHEEDISVFIISKIAFFSHILISLLQQQPYLQLSNPQLKKCFRCPTRTEHLLSTIISLYLISLSEATMGLLLPIIGIIILIIFLIRLVYLINIYRGTDDTPTLNEIEVPPLRSAEFNADDSFNPTYKGSNPNGDILKMLLRRRADSV